MKKIIIQFIIIVISIIACICLILRYNGPLPQQQPDATENTNWTEQDGNTYYQLSDGRYAIGWQEIDGSLYYFDENGIMATGWLQLEDHRYYLRSNGSMVTGWLELEDGKYYLTDSGAATGLTEISGTYYLFNEEGHLSSGWAQEENGTYYCDSQGNPVTGWQEIDGSRYHFDAAGIMLTGWQKIDGALYYLGEDGTMYTGWLQDGYKQFYLTEDGTAAQGKLEIDGVAYFFASNGQSIPFVNPWNYMPEDYTVTLAKIESGHKLADYAVADFEEMMADCRAAGLHPAVCSSYRTIDYQQNLLNRKINQLKRNGYTADEAYAKAITSIAIPGTSEHHLGLALDIVDNGNWQLDSSQEKEPTQQWLMENSWKYGFILRFPNEKSHITGIIYEPWHYRYVGREIAAEIHQLNITLEEYMEMLTK